MTKRKKNGEEQKRQPTKGFFSQKVHGEELEQQQEQGTIAMKVTALAIILIIIVVVPESGALNKWLFRWQELVAGMLAILAAVLTILRMRKMQREDRKMHDG